MAADKGKRKRESDEISVSKRLHLENEEYREYCSYVKGEYTDDEAQYGDEETSTDQKDSDFEECDRIQSLC
jgi:hypothetical protein